MLDTTTININCPIVSGTISKYVPTAGIKMEVAITANEPKTAKIKNLFLKGPTFHIGYIVDLEAID